MISIFAKPPFEMKHLQRVSSIVRGEQIAAYMGNARLNPDSGYENDTCIFVKPHIKPGNSFDFPKHSWIDIHDAFDLVEVLNRYPDVGVIAYSDLAFETLSKHTRNKIALIPHHHVNYERTKRSRDKILKVGTTGSLPAWDYIPDKIKQGLKARGIKLELYTNFYPRMSVARFHESIDVHLHWRPWLNRPLSCPFKIINAASFGVPTIALDEPSFKEVEGTYIGVKTPEEWLEKLDYLIADNSLYDDLVNNCLEVSERYHISKIAKLYEQL
jgi:hypothetical protein